MTFEDSGVCLEEEIFLLHLKITNTRRALAFGLTSTCCHVDNPSSLAVTTVLLKLQKELQTNKVSRVSRKRNDVLKG